jgi:hypothetical protein
MCAMSPRLLRPRASEHPEALAWRARVREEGGSVSGATLNAVSQFCRDIDAAGIRDRFFRLNLFAGTGLNAALVPLYTGPSRTGTQYGSTFDANLGSTSFVSGDYAESGASGGLRGTGAAYLNTGLPMNYPANNGDRHLAVYKNLPATDTHYSIGVVDNTSPSTLYQLVRIAGLYFYFSGGNTENIFASDSAGMWLATGTVNRILYKNGASVANNTNGSDTVNTATRPFFIFAQNSDGSAIGISDERQAGYSIGLSMNAQEVADYYAAMQAFQTTLGRNA